MHFLTQQVVDGLATGSAYALVALGFTLPFGILKVVTVAQKAMVMIGPMAGVVLIRAGYPTLGIILGLGMWVAALAGIAIEPVCIRPFVNPLKVTRRSDAEHLAPFISTLGVVIVAEHLGVRLFGPHVLPFPVNVGEGPIQVAGLFVEPMQVVVLGIALALMVGLDLTIRYTRIGLCVRATAENPQAAAFMGVNVRFVVAFIMAVAGALGGAGGILIAGLDGVASPFMGFSYGVKGIVAMILGGVSSLYGAVVGGLLLGVIEALAVGYVSSSFRDLVAFGLLLMILLLKPRGLVSSPSVRLA